jgi:hypothetical protein
MGLQKSLKSKPIGLLKAESYNFCIHISTHLLNKVDIYVCYTYKNKKGLSL